MHRPNRTPIERINDEVEAGIAKQFPRLLLEMELERHTRKGQRECDCEYCNAKRIGTAMVGHACRNVSWSTLPAESNRVIRGYGSCGPHYEDTYILKHNARDRVRKEVRQNLFEIRNRCE